MGLADKKDDDARDRSSCPQITIANGLGFHFTLALIL
jgi:hypothetical protein